MIESAPEVWFIGAWLLACLLMLAGGIATWVYRIPGARLRDFLNAPLTRGLFITFEDTMRLVRADKQRVIYGLEVAGASIFALDVLVVLAVEILTWFYT